MCWQANSSAKPSVRSWLPLSGLLYKSASFTRLVCQTNVLNLFCMSNKPYLIRDSNPRPLGFMSAMLPTESLRSVLGTCEKQYDNQSQKNFVTKKMWRKHSKNQVVPLIQIYIEKWYSTKIISRKTVFSGFLKLKILLWYKFVLLQNFNDREPA